MVQELKTQKVWFASARQVVEWFQARREATFEEDQTGVRVKLPSSGRKPMRPLVLRVHHVCAPGSTASRAWKTTDIAWTGETGAELNSLTLPADSQDSSVPDPLVPA